MQTLIEAIKDAEKKEVAIGHFNISDIVALKAIFETAKKLLVPVIIGVSEGERNFIGVWQVAALVKSLRDEFQYPVFLNADHTHSIEAAEAAAYAGFDTVLFDGSALTVRENIEQTKLVVRKLKSINRNILIEAELGRIGTSSEIREGIPEGAAVKPEDLTKPEEAVSFIRETGVDLFAPAVGNLHGMMANAPEPALNIKRVREISQLLRIPLVLHGGSGNADADFTAAIDAGIRIIHINTELRLAWKKGLDKALAAYPAEIAPYKILPDVVSEIGNVVQRRLKLFNKLV